MYSNICDHPNYIAKQGHFSILCLFFEAIQCTVPGTKFHRANFSIAALTVQINHLKGQQPETGFWLNGTYLRQKERIQHFSHFIPPLTEICSVFILFSPFSVFSIYSESTPMFSKYCPFIDRHIRHC